MNSLQPEPEKPRRRKPGRAVVLECVPWEMYLQLSAAFGNKPNVRLAYDHEMLEILVPRSAHDLWFSGLSWLVQILTEEFAIPYRGGGRTTMRLKKKRIATEADEIFWFLNAAKMAGVRELDLTLRRPIW